MTETNKESKEMLVGVFALTALIAGRLKDGFQPGADLSALAEKLLLDAEFRDKLKNAVEGSSKIGEEAKDYSVDEVMELAKVSIDGVKMVIAALKTDAVLAEAPAPEAAPVEVASAEAPASEAPVA